MHKQNKKIKGLIKEFTNENLNWPLSNDGEKCSVKMRFEQQMTCKCGHSELEGKKTPSCIYIFSMSVTHTHTHISLSIYDEVARFKSHQLSNKNNAIHM